MITKIDEFRRITESLGTEHTADAPYPESGLNPLFQRSLKSGFDDLTEKFPGLTDIDVRKVDDWYRVYWKYRGREMSMKLDLNGDSTQRAVNGIKRRIMPKHRTTRLINPYRR